MASAATPTPGTVYGPCVDECEHKDCAASRADAAAICRECGKPIGYDRRWYHHADGTRGHDGCQP